MSDNIEKLAPVKPYSKKELCSLYDNVSYETFKAWRKPFEDEIGDYKGGRYDIAQVEIIFQRLGRPRV